MKLVNSYTERTTALSSKIHINLELTYTQLSISTCWYLLGHEVLHLAALVSPPFCSLQGKNTAYELDLGSKTYHKTWTETAAVNNSSGLLTTEQRGIQQSLDSVRLGKDRGWKSLFITSLLTWESCGFPLNFLYSVLMTRSKPSERINIRVKKVVRLYHYFPRVRVYSSRV